MKRSLLSLGIAALVLSAASVLAADKAMPPYFTSYDEARAASAEKNLPLLIDFWKYD